MAGENETTLSNILEALKSRNAELEAEKKKREEESAKVKGAYASVQQSLKAQNAQIAEFEKNIQDNIETLRKAAGQASSAISSAPSNPPTAPQAPGAPDAPTAPPAPGAPDAPTAPPAPDAPPAPEAPPAPGAPEAPAAPDAPSAPSSPQSGDAAKTMEQEIQERKLKKAAQTPSKGADAKQSPPPSPTAGGGDLNAALQAKMAQRRAAMTTGKADSKPSGEGSEVVSGIKAQTKGQKTPAPKAPPSPRSPSGPSFQVKKLRDDIVNLEKELNNFKSGPEFEQLNGILQQLKGTANNAEIQLPRFYDETEAQRKQLDDIVAQMKNREKSKQAIRDAQDVVMQTPYEIERSKGDLTKLSARVEQLKKQSADVQIKVTQYTDRKKEVEDLQKPKTEKQSAAAVEAAPGAPDAPMAPAAPAAPEAPSAPMAPAAPEAPSAPMAPAAPDAPSAPSAPAAPDAPEAPSAPSMADMLKQPKLKTTGQKSAPKEEKPKQDATASSGSAKTVDTAGLFAAIRKRGEAQAVKQKAPTNTKEKQVDDIYSFFSESSDTYSGYDSYKKTEDVTKEALLSLRKKDKPLETKSEREAEYGTVFQDLNKARDKIETTSKAAEKALEGYKKEKALAEQKKLEDARREQELEEQRKLEESRASAEDWDESDEPSRPKAKAPVLPGGKGRLKGMAMAFGGQSKKVEKDPDGTPEQRKPLMDFLKGQGLKEDGLNRDSYKQLVEKLEKISANTVTERQNNQAEKDRVHHFLSKMEKSELSSEDLRDIPKEVLMQLGPEKLQKINEGIAASKLEQEKRNKEKQIIRGILMEPGDYQSPEFAKLNGLVSKETALKQNVFNEQGFDNAFENLSQDKVKAILMAHEEGSQAVKNKREAAIKVAMADKTSEGVPESQFKVDVGELDRLVTAAVANIAPPEVTPVSPAAPAAATPVTPVTPAETAAPSAPTAPPMTEAAASTPTATSTAAAPAVDEPPPPPPPEEETKRRQSVAGATTGRRESAAPATPAAPATSSKTPSIHAMDAAYGTQQKIAVGGEHVTRLKGSPAEFKRDSDIPEGAVPSQSTADTFSTYGSQKDTSKPEVKERHLSREEAQRNREVSDAGPKPPPPTPSTTPRVSVAQPAAPAAATPTPVAAKSSPVVSAQPAPEKVFTQLVSTTIQALKARKSSLEGMTAWWNRRQIDDIIKDLEYTSKDKKAESFRNLDLEHTKLYILEKLAGHEGLKDISNAVQAFGIKPLTQEEAELQIKAETTELSPSKAFADLKISAQNALETIKNQYTKPEEKELFDNTMDAMGTKAPGDITHYKEAVDSFKEGLKGRGDKDPLVKVVNAISEATDKIHEKAPKRPKPSF